VVLVVAMVQDIKAKILSAATKEAVPLHVIAKKAGICLATASKYIYILQAENKVAIQSFGNMRLVRRK